MRTNRSGLKLISHDGQPSGPAQEQARPITEEDYRILTAWRDTLRDFMSASKAILKQANMTPNQYQALLAIRFGSEQEQLTVGELAGNLHIRHNSAVTLINKLVARGVVRRVNSDKDRRVVHLHLTARGEIALRKLVTAHRHELDATAPVLRKILP